MPRRKETSDIPRRSGRKAIDPEARENQLIAYATDLVEERLKNGTASSQEVCFFLKLGSTKERLEKEILEKQGQLLTAKTDQIASQKKSDELFMKALDAMRLYSGNGGPSGEDPNVP